MHIDDWLDDAKQDIYARFVLTYARFPAFRQLECPEFRKKYRLFCTYEGQRYRVTGASRLGDIWLHSNPTEEWAYEHRVDVVECSEWPENHAAYERFLDTRYVISERVRKLRSRFAKEVA